MQKAVKQWWAVPAAVLEDSTGGWLLKGNWQTLSEGGYTDPVDE